MLGASGALTVVTVAGLAAGLGREWLLVHNWGAGARTDAFLVALFLPEAIRMMLGGGLLSSAAMAWWQGVPAHERPGQLSRFTFGMASVGALLAVLCWLAREALLRLIGPGLDAAHLVAAEQALSVLAWSLPAFVLQAAWSVPLHADGRYLLSGLASLAYNLPAVACLAWLGRDCTETAVAWSFVGGAVFSALILLPGVRRMGLPWRELRWSGALMRQMGKQVAPLLGSALTGQGVALLERVVASYLGDGVITLLNLARKLANLPLVALTAVSQVLLGLMSRGQAADREPLLRQGLAACTLITTPAALGLLMSAPALVALLFPGVTGTDRLAPLLGWYAVALVIAGWNALLARYCHAAGDTRLPFACDLAGSLAQAIAMPLLAWAFGLMGLAAATLIGVTVTGAMLLHHNGLWPRVQLSRLVLVSAVPLVLGWLSLAHLPTAPLSRLGVSTVAGVLCLGLVAAVLRPWRPVTSRRRRIEPVVAVEAEMKRANHFDVLRLVAAIAVAMLHLIDLTRLPTFERWLGWLPLQFGLPVFFVLSGYLVSMSWDLRPGWKPYIDRRLRRIVPAYAVVVLVCAVGGVLLSTEGWQAYFSAPGWWRHLVANLTFLNFLQPGLPGVFTGNPLPGTVNGALWTIKVELMFYAVVPLFMAGVKRWGATPVLFIGYVLSACWWTFFTDWAVQSGRPVGHEIAKQMPGQLMYFLAGAWAWCERVRVARWGATWGLGGLVGLICLTWLDGPRTEGADLPDVLVPACLAALVSWLAVGVRARPALELPHDLSYGIYLWHFPIIQVLVSLGAFAAAPWPTAVCAALLVGGMAMLSWRWIEAPAMRRTSAERAAVAP